MPFPCRVSQWPKITRDSARLSRERRPRDPESNDLISFYLSLESRDVIKRRERERESLGAPLIGVSGALGGRGRARRAERSIAFSRTLRACRCHRCSIRERVLFTDPPRIGGAINYRSRRALKIPLTSFRGSAERSRNSDAADRAPTPPPPRRARRNSADRTIARQVRRCLLGLRNK